MGSAVEKPRATKLWSALTRSKAVVSLEGPTPRRAQVMRTDPSAARHTRRDCSRQGGPLGRKGKAALDEAQ